MGYVIKHECYDIEAGKILYGLSVDDSYFQILINLACITSSCKIHEELYGIPKRDFFAQEQCHYWNRWDLGRALTEKLALLCRNYALEPSQSYFWPIINKHFHQLYEECYEYQNERIVESMDFDNLCEGILKNNILICNQHSLTPKEVEEATGHYGEEVFWQKWLYERNGKEMEMIHTDSHTTAIQFFRHINDRSPNENEIGRKANYLESICRSIYDSY